MANTSYFQGVVPFSSFDRSPSPAPFFVIIIGYLTAKRIEGKEGIYT